MDEITHERILETIKRSGWHVSLVLGGPVPTYAYSTGLWHQRGSEFLWAGGAWFANDQIHNIVNAAGTLNLESDRFAFRGDTFRLEPVDPTWVKLLATPVLTLMDDPDVRFQQIVPETNTTVDIPDLSRPYHAASEPGWKWLTEPWPFEVARSAVASTDLQVLSGAAIVEAERWDADMFAIHGREHWTDADLRTVSLGFLLGRDPSLAAALKLADGERITRFDVVSAWSSPSDMLDKEIW